MNELTNQIEDFQERQTPVTLAKKCLEEGYAFVRRVDFERRLHTLVETSEMWVKTQMRFRKPKEIPSRRQVATGFSPWRNAAKYGLFCMG